MLDCRRLIAFEYRNSSFVNEVAIPITFVSVIPVIVLAAVLVHAKKYLVFILGATGRPASPPHFWSKSTDVLILAKGLNVK